MPCCRLNSLCRWLWSVKPADTAASAAAVSARNRARQAQAAEQIKGVGRQAGLPAETTEKMPGAVTRQGGQSLEGPGRGGVVQQQAAHALYWWFRSAFFRRLRVEEISAQVLCSRAQSERHAGFAYQPGKPGVIREDGGIRRQAGRQQGCSGFKKQPVGTRRGILK